MPGDHVQRRVVELGSPEFAEELLYQLHRALHVLVVRHRGEEVARIGQPVAADRAEVRQAQGGAVVLADIAARRGIQQFDAEAHAARQYGDFQRFDLQHAELGDQAQAPGFRDDQHLAVGVEERPLHRGIGAVAVDADAAGRIRRRGGGDAEQAVDEVGILRRQLERAPAQAVRGDRAEFAAADLARQALVAWMRGGRADAVHPGPPRFAARYGEGGSGKQLGIQAVGDLLRGVLPDGQGAGQGFAAEFVAEAGLVGQVVHGVLAFYRNRVTINVISARRSVKIKGRG
ncbi:hypothetical protein D3C78_669940 [compost metagenome]